jgi:hypothetical protein
MSSIAIFYFLIILLPHVYLLFRMHRNFVFISNRIISLEKEMHLLQEKQNLLISELQKLNVQLNVQETTWSSYLTNSNIFYGLLGLSALILLGLFLYNRNSGDVAGVVPDSAEVQTKMVGDCTALLTNGIEKSVGPMSNVNNLGAIRLLEELFNNEVKLENLNSELNNFKSVQRHNARLKYFDPNFKQEVQSSLVQSEPTTIISNSNSEIIPDPCVMKKIIDFLKDLLEIFF